MQAAAVRQLDGDAPGAIDDVVVRQDAAVGVDDEAGAGAATRRVAVVARRAEAERPVEQLRRIGHARARAAPARLASLGRRIDVHDCRINPLDDVGEVDERCGRHAAGRPCRSMDVDALRAPSGRNGGPRETACEDGADQKRHNGCQHDRHESEAAGHLSF